MVNNDHTFHAAHANFSRAGEFQRPAYIFHFRNVTYKLINNRYAFYTVLINNLLLRTARARAPTEKLFILSSHKRRDVSRTKKFSLYTRPSNDLYFNNHYARPLIALIKTLVSSTRSS